MERRRPFHSYGSHACGSLSLGGLTMKYLQLEHVEMVFDTPRGRFHALRDINLNVEQGEFVSIIGHSGCGKSTLLNLVAGLTLPSRGAMLCAGREIAGPGPERAMVFQNHSLLPWLTVYENVRLAVDKVIGRSKNVRERDEWTRHNLEQVHMAHAHSKRPQENSEGHDAARRHRPRVGEGAHTATLGCALRGARRALSREPARRGHGDPRAPRHL